ncbi:MAG TPA: NDP-sugar synthase [Abditibacteriaceae bacterium]|jgi:NDP-sugar pyrophosphorylase family protein
MKFAETSTVDLDRTFAIILAGGEGVRLRPLTSRIPKPLLPVANVSMIGQILHGLQQNGITRAALATGYKAELLRETLGETSNGVSLAHVEENLPLGSGGALRNVLDTVRPEAETLWVAGGDILHSVNIAAAIAHHQHSGALATIITVEVEDTSGFGICECDADGRVRRFLEKPPLGETTSRLANSALWIFSPKIRAELPRGASSLEREVFPRLAARGAVSAFVYDGFWLDCGTPERFIEANQAALDQRFPAILKGAVEGTSLIGDNAAIAPDAQILHSVVGTNAQIESGACVENCIVFDNARIESHAHLRNCIVDNETRVASDTSARDKIF